jgi:hypothetical protein
MWAGVLWRAFSIFWHAAAIGAGTSLGKSNLHIDAPAVALLMIRPAFVTDLLAEILLGKSARG